MTSSLYKNIQLVSSRC